MGGSKGFAAVEGYQPATRRLCELEPSHLDLDTVYALLLPSTLCIAILSASQKGLCRDEYRYVVDSISGSINDEATNTKGWATRAELDLVRH